MPGDGYACDKCGQPFRSPWTWRITIRDPYGEDQTRQFCQPCFGSIEEALGLPSHAVTGANGEITTWKAECAVVLAKTEQVMLLARQEADGRP